MGKRKASLALAVWSLAGAAWAGPKCGLTGSIPERKLSCAQPASRGGLGLAARKVINPALDANPNSDPIFGLESPNCVWSLVSMTEDGRQAWLDETSGMVWGDSVSAPGAPDPGALCAHPAVKGGLATALHLPTMDDLRVCLGHGLIAALPNLKGRLFYIKDSPKYLNGAAGTVLDTKQAKATGYTRSVTCAARVADPKPPKK